MSATTAVRPIRRFFVGCVLLAASRVPVQADPNDYVSTLDYAGGEVELENKFGAASANRLTTPSAAASAFALGYGVTDDWFTEMYAQLDHNVLGTSGLAGYSWENRFRLTESGRFPIDLGWLLEVENSRATPGIWQINTGPMIQAQVESWQLNVDVSWERGYGGSGAIRSLVATQWQVKHFGPGGYAYGVQAFANSGRAGTLPNDTGTPATAWLGPAWFINHRLNNRHRLGGNLAVLGGLNDQSPRITVRGQIEFEF
jgi:hypothetical protein